MIGKLETIELSDGRKFIRDSYSGKCYEILNNETKDYVLCDVAMTEQINELLNNKETEK